MAGRSTALARARTVRKYLLAHGVPEVSIEIQNGRPTSGDTWNACKPVALQSHHIASYPTVANPTPGLALVKRGRVGGVNPLPGPLCNGTAGVDLVYRIICMGLANHPGKGGPWTVTGPCGAYRIPRDTGRPYIWGTEYEGGYTDTVWDKTYTNWRTGKSMTFREFMGRCNAGLAEAIWAINGHGRNPATSADLSTYHGEHGNPWAIGRKPDRRGYTSSVTIGRNEIRKYNSTAAATERDWFDMSTEKDLVAAVKVPWDRQVSVLNVHGEREPRSITQTVVYTGDRALKAVRNTEATLAIVREMAKAQGMTDNQIDRIEENVDKMLAAQEPEIPE